MLSSKLRLPLILVAVAAISWLRRAALCKVISMVEYNVNGATGFTKYAKGSASFAFSTVCESASAVRKIKGMLPSFLSCVASSIPVISPAKSISRIIRSGCIIFICLSASSALSMHPATSKPISCRL